MLCILGGVSEVKEGKSYTKTFVFVVIFCFFLIKLTMLSILVRIKLKRVNDLLIPRDGDAGKRRHVKAEVLIMTSRCLTHSWESQRINFQLAVKSRHPHTAHPSLLQSDLREVSLLVCVLA